MPAFTFGQGGLVFQQGVQRGFGDLGEGFVGGGEHGERAGALERVDQAGGLNGGHQGFERTRGHGGVHDVGRLCRRERTESQKGCQQSLFHIGVLGWG